MTTDRIRRVTSESPCPVCKKPDWCGIATDGSTAFCMRVKSDKQATNGAFIHRLDQPIPRDLLPKPLPPPPSRPNFSALLAEWGRTTTEQMREQYAASLGVTAYSVEAVGGVYAPSMLAWAFPMWSGDGRVVGIRLRSSTKKWAVTGSQEGLFWPFTDPPEDRIAYVCEGPTDTMAAASLGLWAVGRPSCHGAIDHLRRLFGRCGIRQMVVIGDHDPAKKKPDGTFWYPGREGAAALIREMRMMHKLILPPSKDLRAWVAGGASRAMFKVLCDAKRWEIVK